MAQSEHGDERADRGSKGTRQQGEVSAAEAAERGARYIQELTGKEIGGVTGVEPTDDGWVVAVEVVEDRRIPSSSDMIGLYEVDMDLDGTLWSYRRTARYPRGRSSDGSQGS